MNYKTLTILGFVFVFAVGFVSGMEFKAYQIRNAINTAFNKGFPTSNSTSTPTSQSTDEPSFFEEDKKEEIIVIDKNIGEEIILATGNIKINSSEEKKSISSKYSSPVVAKEGTNFIVVNLDITNTTKSEFTFSPDDILLIKDNQQREYRTYRDSFTSIDNYLNYKSLSPSIKQTGNIVYEIPEDATNYSLIAEKEGSKEIFSIKLK